MFSVPRGYQDGFNQWMKQIAALCLTAFMQTSLLFLGLLTFPGNMLLGLGIMLAANVARVYKGPYPFFYVYEQPLWVSGMWVVVILGGALLIAWMVWKLGGGRRAA